MECIEYRRNCSIDVEHKESYEIGYESNQDQPNIWPPDDILPEWRPFMTTFYWSCHKVAITILHAIAIGLGLENTATLLTPHSGHYSQLRLLHYPPIPVGDIDSGKFARMPVHSDWSTITMLFQDDCGGLQVESPAEPGRFIDVDPSAGALVLNVGDLLMRWSNGEYNQDTYVALTLTQVKTT
jgi:isopenicillin N synthase-like dioxygenase